MLLMNKKAWHCAWNPWICISPTASLHKHHQAGYITCFNLRATLALWVACCRLEQLFLVILIKEDELLSTHLFFLSVKLHGPGKYPALELQYQINSLLSLKRLKTNGAKG